MSTNTGTLRRVQLQIAAQQPSRPDYTGLPLDYLLASTEFQLGLEYQALNKLTPEQRIELALDVILAGCECVQCHELYYECKCPSQFGYCTQHLTLEQISTGSYRTGKYSRTYYTAFQCGHIESLEL